MKKIFYVVIVAFILFTPLLSTLAIDLGSDLARDTAGKAGFADADELTLAETLGTIIKAALSFVGVIFLILMVYAGYLWMTARGQEDQIDKARKIIIAAIVGLIITLAAYSITSFVVPAILARSIK